MPANAGTRKPSPCLAAVSRIVPKAQYREGEAVTLKVAAYWAGGATYTYVATRNR